MIDFLPAETRRDHRPLPIPIRIVSLTITEGGYFIDPATGSARRTPTSSPMRDSRLAQAHVSALSDGLKPDTTAGVPPFTVMSCDYIPHNGQVAADAVIGVATWSIRISPPGLRARLHSPTPWSTASPRHHRATRSRSARFGIDDAWPCSARHSANGSWRTISRRPAGAGGGRRHSSTTSRPMS